MILLDTNVISEPLRPAGDPIVLAWLDQQAIETLFLSAISLAELRYGVAALPDGRRKEGLRTALENRVVTLFGSRVLAFDAATADFYASIRARAKTAGLAIGAADGYIAATAAAHGFMVATRDTGPFEAAGVPVINPWINGL
ncbi:type II toxin-antitoxin system VapC family toxin [Pararhizobium sp. YC-54]|uniref:type II toxin-antitoxin system VapC family toxin n=1 Tax=Pararhizobium sp. YC-54 TaxID=2986920 RepID=UPI0021F7C889|nr:type II toxin-antitoxin system VapC family toxin [Pararhizobium sp. YC-54]MCV9997958.1 type II toxin-antitoxin system VapC family toxin [Pararhizobium sp. YC-54]